MVARRPSRLVQRFLAAARRRQAASHVGQAERRFDGRREKPARSSAEGRYAVTGTLSADVCLMIPAPLSPETGPGLAELIVRESINGATAHEFVG